jgi:hypothetical protein
MMKPGCFGAGDADDQQSHVRLYAVFGKQAMKYTNQQQNVLVPAVLRDREQEGMTRQVA